MCAEGSLEISPPRPHIKKCITSGANAPANLPTRARWRADRRMRLIPATKREVDMTQVSLIRVAADPAEELARLTAAAERGDGDAACELGDRYREGRGGVRHSPKNAFRWYARSALAGDPQGQNNLGACFEHGLGCAQSYTRAIGWYRKASAQGEAYASSNLGYCYLRGHGVPADRGAATAWFEKALEQGDERAAEMVEELKS
jgi:TPR repeat protein